MTSSVKERSRQQRMRVAAAPINWGVWRLDPMAPPSNEMLDTVAAAGYEGCELGPVGYLASDPGDVARRFAPRGLDLVAAYVATDLARPLTPEFRQEVESVAAILAAGEGKVLLLGDAMTDARAAVTGRVEQFPETWWTDDEWRQVRENIQTITDVAATHGVSPAVHPHAGTHIESGREIDILFGTAGEEAPLLCLDTGHILIGGVDPVSVLNRYSDRVALVHAKDVASAELDHLRAGDTTYREAVRDGLYCDFGEGLVNWNGIARGLDQAAFAGWMVAEQDRELQQGDPRPAASLRHNREFLRRTFAV
jgi:inosose dehydratase